jgi:hypothetical protein
MKHVQEDKKNKVQTELDLGGGVFSISRQLALLTPGPRNLPPIFIKVHGTEQGPHPGCHLASARQWLL